LPISVSLPAPRKRITLHAGHGLGLGHAGPLGHQLLDGILDRLRRGAQLAKALHE